MLSSAPSRVFISYARKDGASLAQRLQADLTKEGFDAWLDTQRLTGGDIWRNEIAGAIDHANVVLALLSAGSYTSDVCRIEQISALKKGKGIIPILVQSDCEVPDYLKGLQRLDFTNLNLYLALLPKLIISIRKQAGVTAPFVLTPNYNNAPALPENFVNRPELLEDFRNTLFTEGSNRNIALTAMQAWAESGKPCSRRHFAATR